MARGRKNYTLEEQLDKITAEINNMESSLTELKAAKKEIEKEIKTKRLEELNDLIEANGMTFDEVKELLKKD
ncbi:flagellar export protein FliJ [Clostridium sp. AF32-12BH]|uniref:flagellar export protein FliJ n=1 Tax=Clostridium sp. AF32-12BH TaxID=2292006 RepID=UPI000E53DA0D|nr:flagellar export protein FliJ [Clostridium sp. AF32-12BH]RHP47069.1 flagellar export protein FliJ [Clostridium sp. AF32-12BH]